MNKLNTNQIQTISNRISPQLLQNQRLLGLNNLELEQAIRSAIEDNPVLEPDKNVFTEETAFEESKIIGKDSYIKKIDVDTAEYLINKYNKFTDNPFEQLHQMELDAKSMIIGEEIIGNLDNDGYLRASAEDLINSIHLKYGIAVSENEIETVRNLIKHLDPPGLASRNLQESLIAQIEEAQLEEKDRMHLLDLLKNYYDDFTHKRFDNILRKSGISKDYLDRLTDIIQKLNPVPALSTPGADYIIPDFIIVKTDGGFKAELYRDYIPDIRINRVYKKMLDSDSTDHKTKAFLKKRIENANLFLQALKNRKQTLIKVMDAILKRQKEFFMTGGIVLNPMTEKDIASDVNTDISTVSRAVRNKYVQTDFGIFELRSFFSRSLSTSSGEDVSNVLLKRKLKELIDSEDKAKPLSDDKLAKLINQYGYTVARRTVTKYREELKIPKATLRRKIV